MSCASGRESGRLQGSRRGSATQRIRDCDEVSTVDYHTGGEPFRIVVDGVEEPRGANDPRAAPRRRRAARPRAAAPRLRAARPCRHVRLLRRAAERRRARTSASSSSTTPATRRPAGTARSRSSRGRSRPGSSSGERARTASSSTSPRGGWRRGLASRTAGSARCASATCRRSSGPPALRAAGREVDIAFGGAFYASLEERVEPVELPRLIELGRELKAATRGGARRRAPARARAARHLRRDLLAGTRATGR